MLRAEYIHGWFFFFLFFCVDWKGCGHTICSRLGLDGSYKVKLLLLVW